MDKTEKFRTKVYEVKGPDFEVIGKYKTMKTKIELLHKVCGYRWKTTPDNFLRTKFGCPKCSGNARRTTEEFKNKVEEIVGEEYSVLGSYINARTKIKLRHNSCGYEYEVVPYSFINQGNRCPKCAGNLQRANEEFRKLVYSQVKNEYEFLDEYKNRYTKLRCVHKVCGYVWKTSPANFLNKKSRCPKCAGNAPLTNEEFMDRVYDTFEGEYVFLENYINFVTPIKCVHVCGHKWKIAPSNLFQGKRCPRCAKESKGEEFIRKVLESLGIDFEVQKAFEGCVYKRQLLFDFYIYKLNMAIEYDGEHHYKPINFGGRGIEKSVEAFKLTKKRDSIKNKFCRDNNINLLRIPYFLTKEEIKNMLINTINSQEVMQGVLHRSVGL